MHDFKTIEEQIDILKERNLTISDDNFAKDLLERENYYNLINGYKAPFLKNTDPENYLDLCTIEEIYELYKFDREIRKIVFKYILKIENTLRSKISYIFSKYHGHDGYLKYSNFDTLNTYGNEATITRRATAIYRLISKIQNDISNSLKHKDYLKHYVLNHGYIPLWVLVNALPLNRLSNFYKLMKQNERIEVSYYWNIMERELKTYIETLAFYRNLCAHDERLYCSKATSSISDNNVHSALAIPRLSDGNYSYGKQDLFSLMIVFKKMLTPEDFNTAFNRVNGRIASLRTKINSISVDIILDDMGFKGEWWNIKNI
ncbi:Abi family protein [Floccifex sp.]|uniref:Abi family protein n=1 Tax=Floccifex sp. TaxID=2815810 RepID=UPI003F084CC3